MWCTSTSEWTSTNKESRIGAERKSEFWTHPFAYPKNGYPNFLWLTLNHRTILQKNRGLHAIYQHCYEWTIINGSGRRKETRTLDSPFRFNRNVCQIFYFWPKSLDYPPKNRVDIFSFAFSEMRTLSATFIRNRKEIFFCLSFWNLLTNRERNVGTKPVYSPRRSYSWCRSTKHRIFPASCPFWRNTRQVMKNQTWFSSLHSEAISCTWDYPPTEISFCILKKRIMVIILS